MRLALPVHDEHLAAVADFAATLLVLEYRAGREVGRTRVDFPSQLVPAKVATLVDCGVEVLICGALSRPFAAMTVHSGIELVPFVTGGVEEVINAYMQGGLSDTRFRMPGYRESPPWCQQRRCRRRGQGGHRGKGGI